jgi:ribonucleotide monophosphatase NagD (HAD superfamily)
MAPNIAFVFDIDGVLVRGTDPIRGAREALLTLQGHNIPFIFLTNGGGKTEKAHTDLLSMRLGLELSEDQLVQSHTPFRDLVPLYEDKSILAFGGHGQQVRELATAYGFKHVIISSDLITEYPDIHPFPEMTEEHHKAHGRKPRRPSQSAAARGVESHVSGMIDLFDNAMKSVTDQSNGHGTNGKSNDTTNGKSNNGFNGNQSTTTGNGSNGTGSSSGSYNTSNNPSTLSGNETSESTQVTTGSVQNQTSKHHEGHSLPIARPTFDRTTTTIDEETAVQTEKPIEIAAILVWTSPRDWCLDLQLITDLLLSSKGTFGSYSPLNDNPDLPNNGFQQDGQPKIYFANPDLAWATAHHLPRFAQGSFRAALEGIWGQLTRGKAKLIATKYGKPTQEAYRYGEKALVAWNAKTNAGRGGDGTTAPKIDTVYMIGDNPESDIVGANTHQSEAGIVWRSILVETGVHKAGTKPAFEPFHTAKDAKAAVEWVLEQEGMKM